MMIQTLPDGGIAHYAHNLLQALAKRDLNVILCTSKGYELENDCSAFKVYPVMFGLASATTRMIPWLKKETKIPTLIRRFVKLIEYPMNTMQVLWVARKNDINIVHFQSVNLIELIMVLAFRLAGVKVVFTIHNVMPRHGALRRYHRVLYRFMYNICSELIIHTASGKEEIRALFSVDPDKVAVIPHGDYKFFVPSTSMSGEEAKRILGFSPGCKTILFFGAIRANKGLDIILKALPHIRQAEPRSKLLVVGELCESYDRYEAIKREERIADHVFERLDYIPNSEVSVYFFAADVVVLPYNEITQSGVLQIAYAFGRPVVATELPGFREVIANGKNGFLVPLNDVGRLAERIAEILQNDGKLQAMGAYSKFLCDTKYSWDGIAQKTSEVYDKLQALRN